MPKRDQQIKSFEDYITFKCRCSYKKTKNKKKLVYIFVYIHVYFHKILQSKNLLIAFCKNRNSNFELLFSITRKRSETYSKTTQVTHEKLKFVLCVTSHLIL